MKRLLGRLMGIVALAAGLACGGGCASTGMKGTPFFTGEYQKSKGPVEDRVNVWPLLYYREPALAVIWPLFEHVTDEQLAVRPFFSIYDMGDEKKREVNVLWPFFQTDHATGTGRAIPFFWGQDYVVGFPLYWHFDHGGKRTTDLMIPLWWYEREALYYKFYTMLGLAGWEHSKEGDGWRVFPLAGNYEYNNGGHYRFLLWPLGHDYENASGGEKFNMLFPLWYWGKDSKGTTFVSLPWSQGTAKGSGESWRLMFPLFFEMDGADDSAFYTLIGGYSSSPDSFSWLSPLLLSGGARSTSASNTWLLAGLAHWGGDASGSSSHVIPLYYSASGKSGSQFYSLPWSSIADAKGSAWLSPLLLSGGSHSTTTSNMWLLAGLAHWGNDAGGSSSHVVPFYFSSSGKSGNQFYSLPWSSITDASGSAWLSPLLLSGGSHSTAASNTWLLAGLAHWGNDAGGSSSHIVPLYYSSSDKTGSRFFSLPWSSVRDAKNGSWQLAPPLYFHSEDADSARTITPLFAAGKSTKDQSHWNTGIPLWYFQHDREGDFFATLLGGHRSGTDGESWMIYPLLTWNTSHGTTNDFWALAPLAHFRDAPDGGRSHVFPLYYNDNASGTFVSLPYSRWTNTDRTETRLVAPLLSWQTAATNRTDTWLAAALGRISTGDAAGASYFAPLFYNNPESGTFASLAYAHWTNTDKTETRVIPPLLSWQTTATNRTDTWLAAALSRISTGDKPGASYLAPLFYNNPESGTFASLAYAHCTNSDRTETRVIPPLLSWQDSSPKRTDTWLAAGLSRISTGDKPGASYVLPLYYGDPETGTQLTPLYCSWQDNDGKTMLIPPLLGALSAGKEGSKEVWALLGLYAHEWNKQGTLSDRLFPLYAYSPSNYFYTLIAGWRTGADSLAYYCTPLIGSSSDANDRSFWFFPIYSRTVSKASGDSHGHFLWATFHHEKDRSRSTFFPFYGYENYGPITDPKPGTKYEIQGTDFLCLPFCWRTDLRRITTTGPRGNEKTLVNDEYSHGAFPLWSHTTEREACGATHSKSSILLALYDSKHDTTHDTTAPGGLRDYQRSRVLWRVWHYEKLNGDVSVDMLPAITYDAKADGFRNYSFLWRLYRWQRDAEGRRKLDLLFLPLLRDK